MNNDIGQRVYVATRNGVTMRRIKGCICEQEKTYLVLDNGTKCSVKSVGASLFFSRTEANKASELYGAKDTRGGTFERRLDAVRDNMDNCLEQIISDWIGAFKVWLKESAEQFDGTPSAPQWGEIFSDCVVIKQSVLNLFTQMVYGLGYSFKEQIYKIVLDQAFWKYGVLREQPRKRVIGGRSVKSVKLWMSV